MNFVTHSHAGTAVVFFDFGLGDWDEQLGSHFPADARPGVLSWRLADWQRRQLSLLTLHCNGFDAESRVLDVHFLFMQRKDHYSILYGLTPWITRTLTANCPFMGP